MLNAGVSSQRVGVVTLNAIECAHTGCRHLFIPGASGLHTHCSVHRAEQRWPVKDQCVGSVFCRTPSLDVPDPPHDGLNDSMMRALGLR